MKPTIRLAFVIFVTSVFFIHCSSSSENGVPALNNVSDLPSLNAADYDYSITSSASAVEGLTLRSQQNSGNAFSRAACEAYQFKREMFRNAAQVESFRCYIGNLEQEFDNLSVPIDAWGFYEIHFPTIAEEENGPPPVVRIRVGKRNGELGMDVCQADGEDNAYIQSVQFRFSASEEGYSGFAINRYAFNREGETFLGSSREDISIVGTSRDDFTSAEFLSSNQDSNGDNDNWQQRATFTATHETQTNTLSGVNSSQSPQWGNHQSRMYGQWGEDLVGSVQYETTGQHPAPTRQDCLEWWTPPPGEEDAYLENCVNICYDEEGNSSAADENDMCTFTDDGTESFDINNEAEPPVFSLISDASSSYFESVLDASLPQLGDLDAQTAFTETWDCQPDDEFIVIDATESRVISECEVYEELDWDLCWRQEEEARQEEQE